MICGSPRSGSTYFCQLLASTALLGNPREYFNLVARRQQDPDYPASPRKQLCIALSRGATWNGIYGVKVFSSQIRDIGAKVDVFRELPNLSFVRLVRRDLLGQALSLARAHQTGQYGAAAPQQRPPFYDQKRIRRCIADLRAHTEGWNEIIAQRGIRPIILEYEDIVANPQHAVDQVALLMGLALPVPIDPALVSHTVQRDALSMEWRQRFLLETGDEFRHLTGAAKPRSTPDSASAS